NRLRSHLARIVYSHKPSCMSAFFFQAEDGIRDFHVTGVQTCALPIYHRAVVPGEVAQRGAGGGQQLDDERRDEVGARAGVDHARSEERRVGKECSAGWSAEADKEKNEMSEVAMRRHTGE